MDELRELLTLLTGPGGVIAVFVIAFYGLYREWWVMGPSYRRALRWEEAAYRERELVRVLLKMEEEDAA